MAVTQFKEIPFAVPFTFTSIAENTDNSVQVLIPYDIAVYGITITCSNRPFFNYYEYTIQFINYDNGNTLFDEPLYGFNLQTGANTYWKMPSKWFIKKNQKIVCQISTFDGSTTGSYYVTLLGYTCETDPNPGIEPFVYSFPIRVGFQDNIFDSQLAVPFNQQVTNTMAKHMLHDFELKSIVLDPFGFNGFGTIPDMALQIRTQPPYGCKGDPDRKLFDRFVINGVAGGGPLIQQGNSTVAGNGSVAFPMNNVLQYNLPKPEFIPKRGLARVDISPAPTYVSSISIHAALTELCCMALIGNHYA